MEPRAADGPDAPQGGPAEIDFGERSKELEFEQRSRLRRLSSATLSLGFCRTALRRLLTPTASAAAAPVARPLAGSLALTFVGHATVMITTPKLRVLTDPLLEKSLWGLRRAKAAAIALEDLADVGLVLISHAHRDHLSRPTLGLLPRAATIVVPRGCGPRVARLDFARVIELDEDERFEDADVEVTAVPTRHAGSGSGARRGPGCNGYLIRTEGRSVYFAGDTGYFSGFREIGRRFSPDVAVLPIGGYDPAPFRADHLSPLDAVYAFQDLGARVLVPVAHGSFELSYEPIDEPLRWLREAARERNLGAALTALDHGQTCLVR